MPTSIVPVFWRDGCSKQPFAFDPSHLLSGYRNHAPALLFYAFLMGVKEFPRGDIKTAHKALQNYAAGRRTKLRKAKNNANKRMCEALDDDDVHRMDKAKRALCCTEIPLGEMGTDTQPMGELTDMCLWAGFQEP